MRAEFFNEPKGVLFFNPIIRLLAKVFGHKYFIKRCKVCGKIPTEMYGKTCFNHIDKY